MSRLWAAVVTTRNGISTPAGERTQCHALRLSDTSQDCARRIGVVQKHQYPFMRCYGHELVPALGFNELLGATDALH